MADVERWLEHLGLGQYVRTFADNDIDLEVLPHLSEQDLEMLGVSMGHRKKLLHAIASLDAGSGALRRVSSPAEGAQSRAQPRTEAERRQLTVMFVDLVGSTELAARLDPEDMGLVIRAYQDCCAEAVGRWDGHIAKYMGDGVLAYFGWPRAHEDDAERAVRGGLAITKAVGAIDDPRGEALAARVGIATGLVMVGEVIGAGIAQEQAVVGETPNLAARLQALAAPGGVVIGAATRRLVGGLFELADLGPQRFKGFTEPLSAWRVDGEGRAEGRFEALRGQHLTPLVGREHELGMLLERWVWAKDGDGQVVLLTGDPGIGKSRIIQGLLEHIKTDEHFRLRYYCSPYHTNSALHPVIAQLERAAGFSTDDPADVRLAKLEAVLSPAGGGVAEVVPLLAALLSVATGERCPPLNLTPQAQKARTLYALIGQLEGLAARQPVLMIFEDAHWIDPTSIELLGLAIERLHRLPILLLITFRPDFTPPWAGFAHVTLLTLNRLGRNQGAAMITELTGGKDLPAEVLDQILQKSDGVPLFVEELTKTVLETGLLSDAGDRYDLVGPLAPLAIPATLRDSLVARLDRLAPVKEVAQIAAVIGRDFSHDLLAAVSPLPDDQLNAAIDHLVSSELIFRRGIRPEASYSFKHALVQDAAYGTLLRSRRPQLHARIAQALEDLFPDTASTQPELLAHHCAEAGLLDKAIEYWRRAGERAARRAAHTEAIHYFRKALDVLESRPQSPERAGAELKVLTQLGPALMLAKGWPAPEVGTVYERARELARGSQSPATLVPPLVGSWLFYFSRGEFDAADATTDELFQVASASGDPDLLLQAHHAAWPVPMLRGAYATASEHIAKGLALYDYDRHRHHALVYMGHDPAVCGHALGVQIDWALGFPERADRHAQEALQLARRLDHAPTLAFALWFVGNAQAAQGDSAGALATAEELFKLSDEQALVQIRAAALALGGWALAQAGQPKEGIEQLRRALADWHRIGARTYLQVFTCLLAESWMRTDRHAEALECLSQAYAWGEQTGERWWEARIHYLRGHLLLQGRSRDRERAAEAFATAINIARVQQTKAWELRGATSLARLWCDQGRRAEAYDLLAPVYAWFTEGFDTADLKDAKALLDALN